MSYIYSGIGVTRANGDATGVTNMDVGIDTAAYDGFASSLGKILSTGVGKEVGAFKIVVQSGANAGAAAAVALNGTKVTDLYTGAIIFAGNGTPSQIQVGGAVEAIMKVVSQLVTILAYQVENDTSGQISIMFEQTNAWAASKYGTADGNGHPTLLPTNDYGLTVLDLQSAIQALGSTVGYNVSGSTNGQVDVRQTIVTNAGTAATFAAETGASAGLFGNSMKFA
jgi:hypothetical protein